MTMEWGYFADIGHIDFRHGADFAAGRRHALALRDDTGSRVASGTYLVKFQGERGGVALQKVSLVK